MDGQDAQAVGGVSFDPNVGYSLGGAEAPKRMGSYEHLGQEIDLLHTELTELESRLAVVLTHAEPSQDARAAMVPPSPLAERVQAISHARERVRDLISRIDLV